jgi:hypothetical protein
MFQNKAEMYVSGLTSPAEGIGRGTPKPSRVAAFCGRKAAYLIFSGDLREVWEVISLVISPTAVGFCWVLRIK